MRADARAKRQALLEAAWTLVAQRGAEVPLRTVAEEAGVGIGTLYRHFPTREDLIVGLLDHFADRVVAIVGQQIAQWEAGPDRAWRRFVEELAALRFGEIAYQIAPTAERSPGLLQEADRRRDRVTAVLETLMEHAKQDGLLDPAVGPEQLFIGLAAITRPLPAEVLELVPDQPEWLIQIYLRGLRPTA